MIDGLIPICFLGGSGGSFLNSWLTSAKYNVKCELQFSDYGGMHTLKHLELPGHMHAITENIVTKLEYIKSLQFLDNYSERYPPYFTTIHEPAVNVLEYFDRVINITYQIRDTNDLTACFIMKWGRDIRKSASGHYAEQAKLYTDKHHLFKPIKNENVCNVSWTELFYYTDLDPFISKLSLFTGIPTNNFNIENLISWRNKSKETISLVNKLL